jgi:hypothetical protein
VLEVVLEKRLDAKIDQLAPLPAQPALPFAYVQVTLPWRAPQLPIRRSDDDERLPLYPMLRTAEVAEPHAGIRLGSIGVVVFAFL